MGNVQTPAKKKARSGSAGEVELEDAAGKVIQKVTAGKFDNDRII